MRSVLALPRSGHSHCAVPVLGAQTPCGARAELSQRLPVRAVLPKPHSTSRSIDPSLRQLRIHISAADEMETGGNLTGARTSTHVADSRAKSLRAPDKLLLDGGGRNFASRHLPMYSYLSKGERVKLSCRSGISPSSVPGSDALIKLLCSSVISIK